MPATASGTRLVEHFAAQQVLPCYAVNELRVGIEAPVERFGGGCFWWKPRKQ